MSSLLRGGAAPPFPSFPPPPPSPDAPLPCQVMLLRFLKAPCGRHLILEGASLTPLILFAQSSFVSADPTLPPPSPLLFYYRWVPLGAAREVGIFQNMYGDTNAMVHRDVFWSVGGFPEDFGYALEVTQTVSLVLVSLMSRGAVLGAEIEVFPQPKSFSTSQPLTLLTHTPPEPLLLLSCPTHLPRALAGLGALLQVRPVGLQARGGPGPAVLVPPPGHVPQPHNGHPQQQHAHHPALPQDHPGRHASPRHVCAGEDPQRPGTNASLGVQPGCC